MDGGVVVTGRGARPAGRGRHRRLLWRELAGGTGRLLWVLCNPSSADAEVDDPTVRRCVGLAAAWGFGAVEVANLFTLRARDPRALRVAADPVGPGADAALRGAARRCDAVVVAWGSAGRLHGRDRAVLALLAAAGVDAPTCVGVNADGTPRHPLYVPATTRRRPYPGVSDGAGGPARRRPAAAR